MFTFLRVGLVYLLGEVMASSHVYKKSKGVPPQKTASENTDLGRKSFNQPHEHLKINSKNLLNVL